MMTNNTYSRDIVVFDTSVILHDANSIFGFDNHDIIIPLTVLDEVDKFRSLDNGVGRNARSFIRSLKKLIGEDGVLSDGVKRLETGEKLIVRFLEFGELLDVDRVLDLNKNDDRILALCMEVIADAKNVNVSLVTRDISLLAKANALRVSCFDYHIDSQVRDPNQLYTGMAELVVPGNLIDVLHDEGKFSFIDLEPEYVSSFKAHENMGVTLIDESNSSHTSLCLYKKGSFCKLVYSKGMVCNITPQNREQKIALELIMDPDISLITLTGLAGSGKTLLAVAAGIHLAVDKNMYDRLLVSRPIQPLGKDLGYLPGPQPLDAKIRTPSGWTTMGEIKIGDTISAYDGSPSVVLGVFPKGVKSVYKVSTTEGSTECCLDHLWHTTTAEERKRGKSGSVRDTKQIMETIKSTLPGKKLNSHKPRYGSIRPNHFLPRNKPIINDNPKHLLLPSYVLGSILGDGCIGASISISSVDSEIINHISDELKNSGLNCELHHVPNRISYNFSGKYLNNKPAKLVKVQNINSKEVQIYSSVGEASKELNVNSSTIGGRCAGNLTIGGYSYSFLPCKNRWTNEVKNALFKLGLSNKKAWEKFIPEDYLYRSSIEDRISLLQGLMDTDGSVKRKTGEASFTTTSLQLAKDISSLVRSLGGRSIIRSRNRIGKKNKIKGRVITTRRISYEFTISLPNGINPFYLSRKSKYYKSMSSHPEGIIGIEYVGEKEVQCILIDHPDHLYITDDYIITHNTIEEKMDPYMGPIKDAVEFVFGGKREKMMELLQFGMLEIEPLTYIRGRSLPRTFFILDESQNISKHEMKTIISRMGKGSKLILTGDIHQIDNHYLDTVTNGLTGVVEKFKSYGLAGHITLTKGQRSELATLAADIL